MFAKLKLIRILIAVLALLSACSFRKLAIEYSDWLAMHQIDKYFDLSRDQERVLKPIVQQKIADIRRIFGPRVDADIARFQERIRDGVKEEDVRWAMARLQERRIEISNFLAPDVVRFLTSVSVDQVTHCKAAIADANRDGLKLLSASEAWYIKHRRKQVVEQIEYWVGTLSEEQKGHVAESMAQPQADFQRYFETRLANQARFIEVLQTSTKLHSLETYLRQWTEKPIMLAGYSNEQAESFQENRIARLALVGRTLTAEQLARFQDELSKLRHDLGASFPKP